jgi:hypothetical protein
VVVAATVVAGTGTVVTGAGTVVVADTVVDTVNETAT